MNVQRPREYLLVEPINKTPFPPLGLMRISTWLKQKHPSAEVRCAVGTDHHRCLDRPYEILVTSLFTWDLPRVVRIVNHYQDHFPRAKVRIGGIAASLMNEYVEAHTGLKPHVGLLPEVENYPPDYSMTFGRDLRTSITTTSRGCIRNCQFCSVRHMEPVFEVRDGWERDICADKPRITFWDNNWLASPELERDCERLLKIDKIVDFNQGLDARLYTPEVARLLARVRLDPIRFAFDDVRQEKAVIKAIRLAKEHTTREIRVYVLYNYTDTPEDTYYRIDLLNREGVLAFPMQYRRPTTDRRVLPGPRWNQRLLRAFKLSLLFYYRKGMINESRDPFLSIYGHRAEEFVSRLYEIHRGDVARRRQR